MKIDLENLFLKSCNEGINIFTGAGFSILSYNEDDKTLPLGFELANEISSLFSVPDSLPLPNMSAIVESKNKEKFYDFLRKRFNVTHFDEIYNNIKYLNIKNWFTTNIDNLPQKLYDDSTKQYLNNNVLNGPSYGEKNAIEFFPLHGSILIKDRPLIFSPLAIASTFSHSPKLWYDLIRSVEKFPIVFWGYSLNDSGVLQTLDALKTQNIEKQEKWIVLHQDSPSEEEYFKSIGFNIIIASNTELLNYIKAKVNNDNQIDNAKRLISTKELFGKNYVPLPSANLPLREINQFYLGATPIWSDIYSQNLYRTSHFAIIQNLIFSNKNTIVIGTPASGKTTLLMQLAAFTNFKGHKIILNYPSLEQAKYITNTLGDQEAIVFIDNFTYQMEGALHFTKYKNIKLICFDREHNFEIVSHFIERKKYNIHNITTLTDIDLQEIYSRIPDNIKYKSLKKKIHKNDEQPSMFEFVILNLKYQSVGDRYKNIISQLEKEDELLTDFLLLASYVHHCGTPLSFDMAYSYFQDDIINYSAVYDLRNQLGKLITDYIGDLVDDNDQDYFSPRSIIVAETILNQVESKYLRRMLHRFVNTLPPYKIAYYNVFQKNAHDKLIMAHAFQNWEEGKYYFERLLQDDPNNPYLLQQGALYLSYKSKYFDAFYWIEKALKISKNKVFSIRNSHAIILFDGNIKKEDNEVVRETLDRSMDILKKCYMEDKRKMYHVLKFGEQSLEYYKKYGDQKALKYLKEAAIWVEEQIKVDDWHRGLINLRKNIDRIISLGL